MHWTKPFPWNFLGELSMVKERQEENEENVDKNKRPKAKKKLPIDIDTCLILGQEAAHVSFYFCPFSFIILSRNNMALFTFQVSDIYCKVFRVISQPPVKDYVPISWASLAHVKKEHYKALAHFYVALGLLDHR